MCAYVARNAGAVIHTHSKAAVMATLLFPGKEFSCSHLEMIKGIKDQRLGRNIRYDEKLIVPIIENTPFEEDLKDRLSEVIENYPGTCAVLVRRHGVIAIFTCTVLVVVYRSFTGVCVGGYMAAGEGYDRVLRLSFRCCRANEITRLESTFNARGI